VNDPNRGERLQIMLTEDELAALDDWRFSRRMPSRAAAVRELLRRGLAAEGLGSPRTRGKSKDYGVTEQPDSPRGRGNGHSHNGMNGSGGDADA
jgi:hypothetical protein